MTLRPVFEPRSIAVVGASANPSKRGHQILRALVGANGRGDAPAAGGHDSPVAGGARRDGQRVHVGIRSGNPVPRYRGRVYPVNPAGGELLGLAVAPSVAELPEPVDLAVLCTPAATTPGLVRACGERGVAAAVVLAVGFGEAGVEGERLEAALRQAARETGVRVVGPNTSGLLNLPEGVNLIGARGVRPGGIALLVQSGNIALDLMTTLTRETGLGVSICCGLGNEADIGFGEVLAFLGEHEPTRAVIAHVEGCRDSRRLLHAASIVTRQKPVIAIKSGRTAAGARAALSHTGAVAGPYDRLSAGFAQAGVVEVTRTDELVHVTSALVSQASGLPRSEPATSNEPGASRPDPLDRPAPDRRGVAILSDGGGQNTLAVDALHEMDIPLATLSAATSAALRTQLGPAAAVRNPVDVAGAADADPGVFVGAMEAIAADPAVGTVLVVGLFGGYGIRFAQALAGVETDAAQGMAAAARARGKALVVHSQYAAEGSAALDALCDAHVPVLGSLEVACTAVAEVHRWGNRGAREAGAGQWHPTKRVANTNHAVICQVLQEGRVTLAETEARTLLADAGLDAGTMRTAASPDEAAASVARIGRPVAMRLLSRHIIHKSDAGGVVLGVASPDDARQAFARIARNSRVHARSRGLPPEECAVAIAPMLAAPVLELLVGACRDPQLGPVLTLGAGGAWVELLRDVTHRVLPVDADEVEAALGELKAHALLAGWRGGPTVATAPIVEAALAVAECVTRWPQVAEAEINPLFVYADRAVAVDVRVVLADASGE